MVTWTSTDGGIRLYCADCNDVLPTLPNECCDAIITDPPYGIKVGSAFVCEGTRKVRDGEGEFNENAGWEWMQSIDCLIQGGNIAVFHKCRDELPNHVIWWHRFYLVKEAPPPTPRPVFVSAVEECSIGRKSGKSRWFGSGWEMNYWRGLTPNRRNEALHPSQKPLDAIKILVKCLSDEGDTVVDPFMGSGTTGVACVQLGRKFVGVEKERRYFDVAVGRIQKELERVSGGFGLLKRSPKSIRGGFGL